ncbi:MAG: heavy-metal-associated domain-containing protein [Coriobacteriia bacterium]|nr:heavy-metal-associated domain-containing protein [Coriobacteriia bacterium]
MAHLDIPVSGMHCNACEMRVKIALEDLEGVSSAQASFEDELVRVEYDEASVNEEQMKNAIIEEGFAVKE